MESINTNIYSLEELCYYLYHNLYLVDSSVINENLCVWISEQLELPRLAAKIRPHLGKFASAEDVLYPIFKEINYLTYEELKALNLRLAKWDQEAPVLREKRKGDALVENRMYVNAIRVYQKLLKRENLDQAKQGLTMNIWHNLGCAYSYLFQMEKAMECFWEAFLTEGREEELICYLLAYRSVKKPEEYQKKLVELKVTEEVKEELKTDWMLFQREKKLPWASERQMKYWRSLPENITEAQAHESVLLVCVLRKKNCLTENHLYATILLHGRVTT